MVQNGLVSLVGAGPGDSELITIKGVERLKKCQVVIYDRLASDDLLNLVPKDCEKINVGKVVGNHAIKQEEINSIIVKKALEGKKIVRLKGGDPFVFGRGGEEVITLQQEGIPYEVIPGITSAIAAPSFAGIPVTHRGVSQSFHVITGHTKDSDTLITDNYETLAKLEGTLIFLMGMGNLEKIRGELLKYNKPGNTPVAIVSNGTTYQQECVRGNLNNILELVQKTKIKAPAVIIVGGVAGLDMSATIKGELYGKRIGVTGTEKFVNKLSMQLKELNAEVSNLGFLNVTEYSGDENFLETIHKLYTFTWIVFTSTNGVSIFFNTLKAQAVDFRVLNQVKFAVVGEGTKEALAQYGFIADYMPETYTTESLANGLIEHLNGEDMVLLPRALQGSEDINIIFSENNIKYKDVKLYDVTVDEEKALRVFGNMDKYDYITFASASGVTSFFNKLKELGLEKPENVKWVCIGDVTKKALKEYGVNDLITAKEFSAKGIVDCILLDCKA